MAESASLILADATATHRWGGALAAAVLATRPRALIVYLVGDLGAGKTTLARGFLEALGHHGRVPSPTYTLVEPYALSGYRLCHVDLYRIRDPRELEDLGLAEQLSGEVVALIEWPDHGAGHLPAADMRIRLDLVPEGRALTVRPASAGGRDVWGRLALPQGSLPLPPAG
jgi:tRNA threonylcarbamoyladenosine biosynthesis protein TsaE